jgi:hypothetical protein
MEGGKKEGKKKRNSTKAQMIFNWERKKERKKEEQQCQRRSLLVLSNRGVVWKHHEDKRWASWIFRSSVIISWSAWRNEGQVIRWSSWQGGAGQCCRKQSRRRRARGRSLWRSCLGPPGSEVTLLSSFLIFNNKDTIKILNLNLIKFKSD